VGQPKDSVSGGAHRSRPQKIFGSEHSELRLGKTPICASYWRGLDVGAKRSSAKSNGMLRSVVFLLALAAAPATALVAHPAGPGKVHQRQHDPVAA